MKQNKKWSEPKGRKKPPVIITGNTRETYQDYTIQYEELVSRNGFNTFLTHVSKRGKILVTFHDNELSEGRERAYSFINTLT